MDISATTTTQQPIDAWTPARAASGSTDIPFAPSVQDAPAIAWRWSAALPGALFALPAAIVTLRDPSVGLALVFGAVPAGAVGITRARRSRLVSAELAIVMVIGSTYSWLLALCWPSRTAPERSEPTAVSRAVLVDYDVRLGAAGAMTAGLGFALGLEHKGWATAAALLVMRPTAATTQLRSVGRASPSR